MKIPALILFFFLSTFLRAATADSEIESLISYIGSQKDMTFIRNGSEYSADTAASHLRRKWKNAGDKLKSAEDFIQYCAAKSSTSGEPYRIRFADGTEKTVEAVLMARLKTMRAAEQSARQAKPKRSPADRDRL